jgi:hypothetical protein
MLLLVKMKQALANSHNNFVTGMPFKAPQFISEMAVQTSVAHVLKTEQPFLYVDHKVSSFR